VRAISTRQQARDGGALTLSYVIAVPAFLLGLMVILQAAIWYLARETAVAAARQGADVARTSQHPPGAGAAAAVAFARTAAPGFLLAPEASAAGSSPSTVQIKVTGRVPTLVPGLVLRVTEVVSAPVERFVALGNGRVPALLRDAAAGSRPVRRRWRVSARWRMRGDSDA
jgi:TadE-like protein